MFLFAIEFVEIHPKGELAIEELRRRNTEHSSANVGSTEPSRANVQGIMRVLKRII